MGDCDKSSTFRQGKSQGNRNQHTKKTHSDLEFREVAVLKGCFVILPKKVFLWLLIAYVPVSLHFGHLELRALFILVSSVPCRVMAHGRCLIIYGGGAFLMG